MGFLPGKIGLYELAFIHKSASLSDSKGNPLNYERLEYLGDAVLGVIVAEFLYIQFPDRNEGFLTKMRSKLVNGDHLSLLTQQMGLNILLDNRIQNEQANRHILGDTFEALIGAIYLDKGYRKTRRFVLNKVIRKHIDLVELEKNETNFKSQLIEWAQKNRKEITFYTDIEPYDPTHFISFVSIGDTLFGSGTGVSKKEAEQSAALETLQELNV
ncbi:MAG: ribonuclease III [Bacteroidales bacterium]